MEKPGSYDVVVCGAGPTGVVAAIAASREGAHVLLVESTGGVGGLITGGRLTRPQGVIQRGVYLDLLRLTADYGAASEAIRTNELGSYSGLFDPETMKRSIIELLTETDVEVLLYAHVVDVIMQGRRIVGVEVQTKSGRMLLEAPCVIDATGDGDIAELAGAEYMFGREPDSSVQPMTLYFRILGVDLPRLHADALANRADFRELDVHLDDSNAGTNDAYVLGLHLIGYYERIKRAKAEGFNWILPKNYVTIKAGAIPGEVNVNACRFHGDALDPWTRTHAVLEMHRQAYCALDFLKTYVPGFEDAFMLEVAPVLGVRETRRIVGEYVLTGDEATSEARFSDAIGLCLNPVDTHLPGGEGSTMEHVGDGYGIPFRCLVPKGVEGLLLAGRCISVDARAYGSARNTPACAMTGQAAGTAAAIAATRGLLPHQVDVSEVQERLSALGVVLGTRETEGLDDVKRAVQRSTHIETTT